MRANGGEVGRAERLEKSILERISRYHHFDSSEKY
jgi:hypothetical protein